jgi:hypothetical protein
LRRDGDGLSEHDGVAQNFHPAKDFNRPRFLFSGKFPILIAQKIESFPSDLHNCTGRDAVSQIVLLANEDDRDIRRNAGRLSGCQALLIFVVQNEAIRTSGEEDIRALVLFLRCR